MAGAANKLNWAHLFLWQVLLIRLIGPIIFMAGAANKLEWAHYVLWQVLAIKNNGPIQAHWEYCINMINSDGGVTHDTYVRK
jgi:hypothetical protein